MSNIRVGIVGLHNHYHAYPFADQLTRGAVEGMTLIAVADERSELAKAFADQYCDGDWTADYAALINRDDIDAVIITSYTSAHADQVELAAAAGKPVLLDKPISTTLADADRIVAAADKVPVLMAYLLRYLPAYLKVRDAIDAGAIGDVVSGFYSIRYPVGAIVDSPGRPSRAGTSIRSGAAGVDSSTTACTSPTSSAGSARASR